MMRAAPYFCAPLSALFLIGCTHYAQIPTPAAAMPDNSGPATLPVLTSGYYGEHHMSDGRTYCSVSPAWHKAHPLCPAKPYAYEGGTLYAVLPADFAKWYDGVLDVESPVKVP